MRKILSMALVCALALCGGAFAQCAGNLNNGGFVTAKDGVTFVSTGEKIYRIDAEGKKEIADANAAMLQIEGDRLYYVERTFDDEKYGYDEEISQTPMSCALDGSDEKILGDSRIVGVETDYETYTYDTYVGYQGFTVYNGRIYFLANGSAGGEYDCNLRYVDENGEMKTQTQKATYLNGISLFSMAPDGSDEKELIKNIGNGLCRFAVANDKIYLAGGFADMLYAYNYTNFAVYNLDGTLEKLYPGVADEEKSFFSASGNYYAIADACQADAATMYVGLQDSEGDFRSSQLCRLTDDGETELELIQDSMINSVIVDSNVYYVGSASDNLFYEEGFDYNQTLGIYVKKLGETGMGQKLAAITDEEVYSVSISVVDGYVYYKAGDGEIYRLPATGGVSELVAE